MINQIDIDDFWNWFRVNCNELHSDKYPNDLFEELDKRVASFGLWWEVGPGTTKENSLIISVSGRRELIERAKNFVAYTPTLDYWEFTILKKPKTNWYVLELPNDNIKLSAIDWEYTLLKYEDGKKEILIKGDTLVNIESSRRIEVAEIVLTNLLGEERVMDELNYLDVIELDDNTYGMHKIQELIKHLDYIKNGA